MKKMIFRVDDRLIHGQIIEGWIKQFHIPLVVIANDRIKNDVVQQMIYQSVVPPKTEVRFCTPEELKEDWEKFKDKNALILFENISDLVKCESIISEDIYINIGCVASREHKIKVSDTVYLESDEFDMLAELSSRWDIHVKKLPWEKGFLFCELEQ